MEREGDGNTNCNWCTWNDPQRLGKEAGGAKIGGRAEDHSNYSIDKVSQNTEKSPGDQRKLSISQTSERSIRERWYEKLARIVMYIYIYIYSKVKLVTVVEGDTKAPFSTTTTPRCRGGCYFFP